MTAEWHYHGHYGKLGPLTREQIDELIEAGVILRETWVWKNGMPDWLPAAQIPELQSFFESETHSVPPPLPTDRPTTAPPPALRAFSNEPPSLAQTNYVRLLADRSDRSRIIGGVLQFVFPGVGRMYLGYSAIGVLQLVLSLCGIGLLWSWIDGIVIVAGGVKIDGYGRRFND